MNFENFHKEQKETIERLQRELTNSNLHNEKLREDIATITRHINEMVALKLKLTKKELDEMIVVIDQMIEFEQRHKPQ